MLKFFALTLTLFFIIPTHSMHIKPSHLLKRSYATMAPKDFDKLVSIQKDGYPLDSSIFVSELNSMKKDDEDLKSLQRSLEYQIYFFNRDNRNRFEAFEWHNSEIYLPRSQAALIVGLSILGGSYIEGIHEMLVPQLLSAYFIGLGVYGVCKWLPVKRESERKNKIYSGYQKNLAHVKSLLKHSKGEPMLGKKYGE